MASLAYLPPLSISSAIWSLVPMLTLLFAGHSVWPPSFFFAASLSLAIFFSLSVFSALISFVLASSSSLSPRLNGSRSSVSGYGATLVSGCHFLVLPPVPGDGCRWPCVGVGLRYRASTSSTGPPCGATGVGLKRSGFARGRCGRGLCGAVVEKSQNFRKILNTICCS
jgi:hypothetical protein